MDNAKTGALIKELRKEKNMSHRELAEVMHITDRAVSKWERGINAPDIALLEPLAEVLGVSVLELIEGERKPEEQQGGEHENVSSVLAYSQGEIKRKARQLTRRVLGIGAASLLIVVVIIGYLVWRSGILFVVDRSTSPDGSMEATVYNREISGRGFSLGRATSVVTDMGDEREIRTVYGDCGYGGLWWSPDSRKYVLALESSGGTYHVLAWLDRSSSSNLNAYLSMGVQETELVEYGDEEHKHTNRPDIEYQFLQWGKDSASMLIYYSFTGYDGELHEGYFWYNCEEGTVNSILELNQD